MFTLVQKKKGNGLYRIQIPILEKVEDANIHNMCKKDVQYV